jgi:carbohydrate-selective porin OprB
MIYRPGGPGTTQGATIWAAYSYNNQDRISPMPQFWAAGASYLGLIPARKDDVVSLGFVGSEGSKFGPPLNTERLLELNYQWIHSRYLAITPHGQYLWLNGTPAHKNALVLGVQLALTL